MSLNVNLFHSCAPDVISNNFKEASEVGGWLDSLVRAFVTVPPLGGFITRNALSRFRRPEYEIRVSTGLVSSATGGGLCLGLSLWLGDDRLLAPSLQVLFLLWASASQHPLSIRTQSHGRSAQPHDLSLT